MATVLLACGTIGFLDAQSIGGDLIGQEVSVYLADENGLDIVVDGVLEEILED